jgi:hypothetical protein
VGEGERGRLVGGCEGNGRGRTSRRLSDAREARKREEAEEGCGTVALGMGNL